METETKKLLDKKNINIMIFLCSAIYFVSYITRINYAAVLVEIISDKGITKAVASMAVTGSFITYGAGQLISGYLGDKLKPHLIISAGLITTAAMNIAVPFLSSRLMIVAWCINGLAQAMMWPPLVKVLTAMFTDDVYRKAAVRVSWGSSFGTIAVYLFAPVLISISGWQSVFFVSATAAVLTTFLWIKIYSAMQKHTVLHEEKTAAQNGEETGGKRIRIWSIFALIMPAIAMQGLLRDGITTWMPSYISETYHLGNSISILTGVVLPLFSIFCYQMATRLNRKVIKNELACSGAIFSVGFLASLLLAFVSSSGAAISVALSAVITGCMHGVNVLLICMLAPYFRKFGRVSLISGLLNACTYIGSAISAYGIAVISDNFGWNITIKVWAAVALAGTVICFCAAGIWDRFKRQMQ